MFSGVYLVAIFNSGAIAAEITDRYSLFKVADELITIAFYLNHQQQLEAYLGQLLQQAPASLVRELNQTKLHPLFKGDRVRSHVSRS